MNDIHKFKCNRNFSKWKEKRSLLKTIKAFHSPIFRMLPHLNVIKDHIFLDFDLLLQINLKKIFFSLRFVTQSKISYFSTVIFYVTSLLVIDTN